MPGHGILLFTGTNRSRKIERLHELAGELKVMPADRHQLDGPSVTAGVLLSLCRQVPFESPVRLISIDAAHRLDQGCVEALADAAELIRTGVCVVLLAEAELGDGHPLAMLGQAATVEHFPDREPAARPFALVEAVGRSDAVRALQVLQEQLASGKDLLELLGLLAWQLQRWVTVRRLQEIGHDTERIAQICGMKPWQVSRVQTEVAGRPVASLTRLLERCWRVDVDLKTGRTAGTPAVEQLVLEMCGVG